MTFSKAYTDELFEQMGIEEAGAAENGVHRRIAEISGLPFTKILAGLLALSSNDHHRHWLVINSFALLKSRFHLIQIDQTEGHRSS